MDEDYDIPRSHFLPAPIPKKQNTIDSINDDYDELPMKIQPTYDVIKPPIKTLISSDIGSSNGALSGLSFGSRNSIASNSSSDSTSMYHIKVTAFKIIFVASSTRYKEQICLINYYRSMPGHYQSTPIKQWIS